MKILEETRAKLSDAIHNAAKHVILNHTAFVVQGGCRDYRINNIAVAIAVTDHNLNP